MVDMRVLGVYDLHSHQIWTKLVSLFNPFLVGLAQTSCTQPKVHTLQQTQSQIYSGVHCRSPPQTSAGDHKTLITPPSLSYTLPYLSLLNTFGDVLKLWLFSPLCFFCFDLSRDLLVFWNSFIFSCAIKKSRWKLCLLHILFDSDKMVRLCLHL